MMRSNLRLPPAQAGRMGRLHTPTCCCLQHYGGTITTRRIAQQPAASRPVAAIRPLLQPQPQQQQPRGQRGSVQTQAVQVDVVLGGLSKIPSWGIAAVLIAGMLLGIVIGSWLNRYMRKQVDPGYALLENAELRTKLEELQQLVLKVQPLAYKSMRLRFTKGINKMVILGLVDQMLANKEVNIWWLPDSLERLLYFNIFTLSLAVLEEVVDGMSLSLAGHNVRLQLSYLDATGDGDAVPPSKQALKTEAMLKHAMQPPKEYGPVAAAVCGSQ